MTRPESLLPELPVTEEFRPEYLRETGILPLRVADGLLHVAVRGAPPSDVLEDLEQFYGVPLHLTEVDADALDEAIRRTFAASESVIELVRALDGGPDGEAGLANDELTDLRDLANQAPVVRYVNLLLREAHAAGASDVHLEALREGLRARLRVDGVLAEAPGPPRGLQHAVISRVKLLAGMDIAERRTPQDGRIRVRMEERDLDLRVSTVPTLHGESVVVRLLDHGGRPATLAELGMPPDLLAGMTRLARRPHGILLATGPTGSGKTTTLYAALSLRDRTAEKIITVEDPVEYDLPGIAQMPVQARAGMTFGKALRNILRQDPDVLMVGEMRDGETAGIAVQAAMTGHLVFSTLHTNDAPAAVPRLRDLGVEAYLLAATLEGVLAQRLVRRTCPSCRERYDPEPQAVAYLGGQPVGEADRRWRWERGAGCVECRGTGFRGRTGIFELMPVDDAVRAAILPGVGEEPLRAAARGAGMRTLREDGWRAARAGLTTVEEVLRVLGA
jgi:general secretion pathway protein E